jgi:hypothetical protein
MVHIFLKKLGATSKLWAPEGGLEESSILRLHKYDMPPYKI